MSEAKPTPDQEQAQPTPDQKRAKDAWQAVQKLLDEQKKSKEEKRNSEPVEAPKDFGGAARKLPVRIMASGLGQALAFLAGKAKTPFLMRVLGNWVLGSVDEKKTRTGELELRLLNAVINGNADQLRIYTQETMAYLVWLNRFCEANNLFDDVDSNNGN